MYILTDRVQNRGRDDMALRGMDSGSGVAAARRYHSSSRTHFHGSADDDDGDRGARWDCRARPPHPPITVDREKESTRVLIFFVP